MKKVNEANMNISVNGESASEVSELLRIMQLAGSDAKEVDIDDINQKMLPSPEDDGPCDVCGGDHGPSDLMAGCGGKSSSETMADTIRMISKEEDDYDGNFGDATTEPDDEYMRSNAGDVSDMIPSGDDLHKEKGSHPATAGGDNPMNTRESIHAMLTKALAEKQASKEPKPDFPDLDGDGNKEEPMSQAIAQRDGEDEDEDKKSKGIKAMVDAGNKKADAEAKESISEAPFKKAGEKGDGSAKFDEMGCKKEMMKLNASGCAKHEMYNKVAEKYGCSKGKFEKLYASHCG